MNVNTAGVPLAAAAYVLGIGLYLFLVLPGRAAIAGAAEAALLVVAVVFLLTGGWKIKTHPDVGVWLLDLGWISFLIAAGSLVLASLIALVVVVAQALSHQSEGVAQVLGVAVGAVAVLAGTVFTKQFEAGKGWFSAGALSKKELQDNFGKTFAENTVPWSALWEDELSQTPEVVGWGLKSRHRRAQLIERFIKTTASGSGPAIITIVPNAPQQSRRIAVAILPVIAIVALASVIYWQRQPLSSWFGEQTHVTAVTAIATLVAAAATAAIALANYSLIRATKEQVSATQQQVIATQQTVKEVQRDRSLQWSPYVIAERKGDDVAFRNVGRGAALTVFYIRLEGLMKSWHKSDPVTVLPQGDLSVKTKVHAAPPPPDGILPEKISEAWFCRDQLGRRMRFMHKQTSPDIWDPSEPDSPQRPWADWMISVS